MNNNIYVGAMSGTSHDSVDVSFIEVINSIKTTGELPGEELKAAVEAFVSTLEKKEE